MTTPGQKQITNQVFILRNGWFVDTLGGYQHHDISKRVISLKDAVKITNHHVEADITIKQAFQYLYDLNLLNNN